ncbi:MAG: IPT/TIG domain-containing protein, partial [Bacillota bacterium]
MLKPKAVVFFLLFAFIFGFGLLQAGVLFAEEEPEEPVEEPNPPRIESINPNFGQAGDLITITGRYLKDVVSIRIGNITVTEGDVNWRTPSATAVGLVIPDGLTGVVEIEIISRDGHQAKLESAFTFSGEIDPVVSSISPNIGGLSGGTSVTISGENFKQNIGPDGNPVLPQVRFGEVMARSVSLFNTREITAITPGAIAEGKVDVWLKNPVEGAEWVKTDLEFEYVNEGKLARILNITPNSGTMLGGTEITVQGVNFPASLEEAAVDLLIGRVPVERGSIEIEPYGFYDEDGNFVQYFEEGNPIYIINARTDQSQLSGEQDVELLIDWTEGPKAGRSEIALFEKGFTYYYPSTKPVIERVVNIVTQKDVGPVGGGHEIEIRGSDFRSGAKVFFGDKEARIIGSVTLNLIRVELPPSDFSGQVDVLVVNYIDDFPTGQFLFENGFTYRRTGMEISSVTPKEVSTVGIRNFTITGHNFNEDIKRLTKVYFEVEKPDPMHPGETFIDQEPLTIIYFDPQADGTLLVAESPTNPSSGLKYLVVENSYGRVISKEPVLFYPPDIKPEIHTVTQAVYEGDQPPSPRGPTAGGTRFIINGNYLTTGTRVFVGDVEAAVDERLSDFTRLEVVSPPGTPGWKDVRVLSLTGNTATMEANPDAEEGYKGFYYYSEPKINNVSPNRGSILGDNIITITGEQFYPGAVVNFGYFDEANKFVSVTEEVRELIVLDSKTIKLRLPQLKEGEILRPEGYLVQVVNTDNRSTTWAKNFQYRIPDLEKKIKIHSVNPAIGHVDGGTKVAIRGENFHPDAVVHFGWEKADIQAINDREIVVIIPPNLAGEYVVTVSNYADTGTDTWESFEYLDPSSFPKIMGVFPEVGPAKGGTNIIITGIGFWNGAKVYIGGRIAEDVEIYHTYITAKTPASDKAGPVDVMVINPDGGADTLFDGFTYKFPDSEPKITSVNPNKIPATGGSIVTIKGEDFRKEVVVYFGTEKAEILEFIEPDTIIVKAPPYTLGEEGIVDVTVLNRDGGIAQSLDESQQIHYYSAKSEPIIDSITPKRGPAAGGTRVIIEGDGFSSKGVKVYFGGREATLAEDAPLRYDRLEVITPPGVPGSVVHVTVMNTHQDALGSATLSNAYTYDASKPVIDSIAPNQATYLGGTLITIRGSGFTKAGAEVYIGEWQGEEVRVIDSETITFVTARIAERPEDLTELRWWDVKVINADGIEVVKEKAFRYLFPDSEPRIISISPEEGSTLGGMPLTLIGTDFRQRAKVVIGGKEAEILSIDDSPGAGNAKIIVKTPAHTPGEKDVTVINYEGAISNSKTFTYVTPLSFPEIFELDPKYGSTLGDTEVIITGIGFKAGAKVWFGMYEAGEVEFIDYKTLKVLTPPGNEGMADVLVLNEDMGQAVLEKGFRYVKSKEFVVNSITPD